MPDWQFIAILGVLLMVYAVFGWFIEWRLWNGGRCRACGALMVCFDMDSQGGRGWCCRNHERTVYGPWISYPFIDGY
jgi:hypothetical protein